MRPGRKNLKLFRGVLESAGLGEVSYFLKKAQQNILYASTSLSNTDFSSLDDLTSIQEKIVRIRELVSEVDSDINSAGQKLSMIAIEKEESEEMENV